MRTMGRPFMHALGAGVGLILLFGSAQAAAQEEDGALTAEDVSDAPEADPADDGAPEADPADGGGPEADPADGDAAGDGDAGGGDAAGESEHFPRFRWGISGVGGPMLGQLDGGVGGVDARFGVQLNERLGIYGQPVGLVGAGASAGSASGLALAGVGALADFTFADMFYLAIGPELVYGGLAAATTTTGTAAAGGFFSVAARGGVVLGPKRPEKRSGFQLGLDARMVVTPSGVVVMPLLALGYEAY